MPSSSRARSRSDRVRGLIPSSERSSSQKRAFPSARSRTIRRVHLPQTTSAVRQTGHSALLTALISSPWGGVPWLHRPRKHFNKCSAVALLTEAKGWDDLPHVDLEAGFAVAIGEGHAFARLNF